MGTGHAKPVNLPGGVFASLQFGGRRYLLAAVKPTGKAPGCPVVGIGASAGGLEAFTQLLKQLPLDTGFGFVLVQHLDPQHQSALTQLLTRVTTLPVREVTNNLRVKANHVYIIPPNRTMGIARGVLKLQLRSRDHTALRSIDFFFEALANDQRERAIGVVLSGSATDGTLGLEAIKAEGGLTFAQDDTAHYDSMPRSAVAAGCVDFVLAPEAIARELARIARHPYVAGRPPKSRFRLPPASRARKASPEFAGHREQNDRRKILLLLNAHFGVDFSLYKSTTIDRRIARRMVLNRLDTLADYAGFLRGNPRELEALYADALIGVTSFFRNAEAFEVLKHKVFSRLLQARGDEPVRVWVLGCSTGQEAYSIAMAFEESAGKFSPGRKLQMFATDLSEANLGKARDGLYAKTAVQDVSPERLRRFFVEEDAGYRVIKSVRERIVFARQNVIGDPPFSRMDLISCRNLMIYFEPGLQKKVLPAFHYALKPEGFLFLGASESIGSFTDLFMPVDKKQKIFSRQTAPIRGFHLPVRNPGGGRPVTGKGPRPFPPAGPAPRRAPEDVSGEFNAEREADRVTVNHFAPPGVLIDANLQILQFRGPTGPYLEPPTGKASFSLLRMAREGLMLPLRAAINRAKKENKTARRENVPVRQSGKTRMVNVEVVPLKNLKERCFLVWFEDSKKGGRAVPDPAPSEQPGGAAKTTRPAGKREESRRVAGLERDLAEVRDYLQSVQERQEATTEELQAANEEGQSANEELQSLNEELETSKEELESTNEELTTVNEEMVSRNAELNRLNSDLTNLQTSAKLVIMLLGRDLTIRRFSAQAEKQFSLLATDVGRPIGAVRHHLRLASLDALISDVIATTHECDLEVQDKDGRWYSLRVRPYLTHDHKVDGAVLVLVDIDHLKQAEQLIVEEHDHAEAVIRTVPNPLVILSSDLCLLSANDAFYRTFKVTPAETKGRSIFTIDHGAWNIPRLRHFLKDVIPGKTSFDDFEVTHNFGRLGRRSLLLNARVLNEPGHRRKEVLLGIQDITEVLTFQADLRRSEMRYRRLFEAAKDGILILDPATRKITDANPFIVNLLGYSRKQLIKKELWEIGLIKDEAANRKAFRELKTKGFIRYEDLPLKSRGGRRLEVEFVSNLYDEAGDEVIQCNIRDITERKQAERELIASEKRYRALFELGPVGVYSCDAAGTIQEFNRRAAELWGRKPKLGDPRERFCGSSKMHLPNGSPLPHEQCPMALVLDGTIPSVRDQEVVIERPDGSRITSIVNIVSLKNERGEIAGAINCFYDITGRKQAEEALRATRTELARYAGQLEGLVTARTAELTAANTRLETTLDSVRKGQEQYRVLLLESQSMQGKLRQLTHQIITVQEEERREISRELHDEVVQTLVGINVELAALGKMANGEAGPLREKIAHTQGLVENSVHAVHRFARGLRPAVLDDLGLIPALHSYCKGLTEQKNIQIEITAFGGVEALDGAGKTVLFRVAQEALTNVIRHAQAAQVKVTIAETQDAIRMEISDDGQSFHVEKVLLAKNPKRLGLIGMKERIEMIGGNLTIESAPGRGTSVCARIPFIREKAKS